MYALIMIFTLFLAVIAIIPISTMESLAHRDGCHRWHSCPSHGSYVCGDLGYDDECGSSGGIEKGESDENGSKGDSNDGEQVSPLPL
jgi:hypothetical protein